MNIITAVKHMFGLTEYKRILGDVDLTSEMIEHIDFWRDMQTGNAPWNNNAAGIGIPQGICRELADVAINEMTVKIENDTVQKVIDELTESLNENLQDGLALGSLILKPYYKKDGTVGIEYVTADRFVPIKISDTGDLLDVAFIQTLIKSETERWYRIERHTLTNDGLVITNQAYSGNQGNIGNQIPLHSVEIWSNLAEEIMYKIDHMDFGYYRNPVKNRIDYGKCGVSIYSGAEALVERADKQAARIEWEFESGERAVHVDERALKHRKGQVYMPELNNRLYRGLDLDAGNQELLKEYSPDFRQADLIQGLESYLRQIEFIVGLSYGDLSNVQEVDKTAEEIRASKQRKFNRVTAIQSNLKHCLEDLVDAIAFYAGVYTSPRTTVINFEDSILTDERNARKQDREDVKLGIMCREEYRVRWYGEDPEEAEKNVPDIEDVPTISNRVSAEE